MQTNFRSPLRSLHIQPKKMCCLRILFCRGVRTPSTLVAAVELDYDPPTVINPSENFQNGGEIYGAHANFAEVMLAPMGLRMVSTHECKDFFPHILEMDNNQSLVIGPNNFARI